MVTIYTAVTCFELIFSTLFWCHPIKRFWSLDQDSCRTESILGYVLNLTITHLTTDFAIFFLGVAIIRTLKMKRREIIALLFIFVLAFLTICTAFIRGALQLKTIIATNKRESVNNFSDTLLITSETEILGAIIAVSLPLFRIYIRRGKVSNSPGWMRSLKPISLTNKTNTKESHSVDVRDITLREGQEGNGSLQNLEANDAHDLHY